MRSLVNHGYLGASPPATVSAFSGPSDTLGAMERAALGSRGEQSILVRRFTEEVVRFVWPKDYLGEILAIRNVLLQPSPWTGVPLLRYTNDPRHVELVKDPQRIVEEINALGSSTCDCFPVGTLVLRDDYELVPIEQVVPGNRIWGYDKWSTVQGTVYKGTLPVDVVTLTNGSQVSLTGDHKAVVAVCEKHDHRKVNKAGVRCSCPPSERVRQERRVSELRVADVLLRPERVAFGSDDLDPGRAFVEGLFVSDGWLRNNTSFAISGQDGCPKEAQKRQVQEICARLGFRTAWRRKSIDVFDRDWALRMQLMGHHAPNKHILSINLGEASAAATLRGVMADSGKNTGTTSRTFTTTSHRLMVQTRVLHRMFGISCGVRYIVNHGGLGTNPIWRLGTRGGAKGVATQERLLRVKSIDRRVYEAPCYDIATDDHYVYLPEHDVTVHNCDESTTLLATMYMQLGREVKFVALGFNGRHLTHVALVVKEPKSGRWIFVDTVAGPREREAATRAQAKLFHSLD